MAEFKDRILSLRNEKHFTQEQLAKELKVSKSTIAMWESGERKPSPEKFEDIADYFNADTDYLYGRSDIKRKIHYDESGEEYVNSMCVREQSMPYGCDYYLNIDAAKTAQEIYENDKILFDVYRSSDKNRLIEYAKKLMELRKMEEGDD